MVYEIHTYGGGEFLVTILTAIKLLLGGSAYLTLIKAMAVLGLIIFIGWVVFSFRFHLSWLLWFALAYLGFFVPKVDVSVIDHLRPADTQVVTGVPALLGYAGHVSSALGDGLTRLMEQAFSLPADIEFRSAGSTTFSTARRRSTRSSPARILWRPSLPIIRADSPRHTSQAMGPKSRVRRRSSRVRRDTTG